MANVNKPIYDLFLDAWEAMANVNKPIYDLFLDAWEAMANVNKPIYDLFLDARHGAIIGTFPFLELGLLVVNVYKYKRCWTWTATWTRRSLDLVSRHCIRMCRRSKTKKKTMVWGLKVQTMVPMLVLVHNQGIA
jgi:hypothetical protein